MGFAQKGAAPVREVSPFSISASCCGDFLSGAWRDHRRPPSRRHFLPFCREAMDHPGAALFCFFALVLFEKYFTKGIASEFLGNRLLASAHVFAAAVSPLMARAVRQREIFRQTRSGFIRGGVFSILDLHRRHIAFFGRLPRMETFRQNPEFWVGLFFVRGEGFGFFHMFWVLRFSSRRQGKIVTMKGNFSL
jgi:hypothetical protein